MNCIMKRCHFDREAFRKVLKLKGLRVPTKQCSLVTNRLKGLLLSLRHVKPVVQDSTPSSRIILLDKSLSNEEELPTEVKDIVREGGMEMVEYELEVGYSKLTALEVLKEVLPDGITIPTSFESVGHIAHLNLREEQLPYKHTIGKIFLDKNPSILTVINKKAKVENEFRLIDYELLAGVDDLQTEIKQGGFRFQLDFGKVYWNSRLEYEHKRLVDLFSPDEVVVDLMAGIGPFAIPAAKKGCMVIANDKNPDSFHYLLQNIKLNKVAGRILPFNLDARECLQVLVGLKGSLVDYFPPDFVEEVNKWRQKTSKKKERFELPSLPRSFHHVVMNYPQYAIEFLDMFRGAFNRDHWSEDTLPIVHCYAFMKEGETESDMKLKCQQALGDLTAELNIDFHIVRNVSPQKVMCCMSFQLPACIAFARGVEPGAFEEDLFVQKTVKKQKCGIVKDG